MILMEASVFSSWRRPQTPALILALAVLLMSCGGNSSDNGGTATDTGAAPPPPATANEVKATSRDQLQDGGKLTWPVSSLPSNWNYNQLDGTEQDGTYMILALMPQVFIADAKGALSYNPDYLTGPPTLVTEPKQVVTYELNPKAMWYDGTPVTWEDL
jgi:peptide/nickel transport system substrate-binding protein